MEEQEKRALARALQPVVSRVRTDVTAVKADGRQGWTNEALTEPRLMLHVNGAGPARGCCPIKEGESVTMLALYDLDSHKGEIVWSDMVAQAVEIKETGELFGLHPVIFRSSGGNGIHMLYLWDEPQDAYSVRQQMVAVLDACGLRNGTGGLVKNEVEVFPKQDKVPVGGFGNQFILPLAGKSEPMLEAFDYEPMGKELAIDMEWPVSEPVPVVEKVPRALVAPSEIVGLDVLRSALAAIPNEDDGEQDYDAWRNIIFGIHAETGGDEDGRALAHEFSARSSKYDPDFLDNRVWPHIKDRPDGISGRSILAMAREHGWREDISAMFEVLPDEGPAAAGDVLPAFQRNRNGEIVATLDNIVRGLGSYAMTHKRVAWDEFLGSLAITSDRDGLTGWRPFEDADAVELRMRLGEQDFRPISKELMRDALCLVARENRFDTAILWARRLKWDGVPRVDRFFSDYFHSGDSDYAVAVSRYVWTALAGRCLQPGLKADIAPILIGDQGIMKSSGIAAMVPNDEWFCELDLAADDDKKARLLRGKLVTEFGEMRGMYSREVEHIKAFMSRTFEEWVPKFIEFSTRYYRRTVFIGTSNEDEVLTDSTGNRRWAPIRVAKVDIDAIIRDREQLWAEAIVRFEAEGLAWRDIENLAKDKHAAHLVHDAWEAPISAWLAGEDDGVARASRSVQMLEIITGALGIFVANSDRKTELRVGKIMRELGWEKRDTWIAGKNRKAWHKK